MDTVASEKATDRNRLDHILPQGYLEGFTIPSKEGRLWVFDIERRKWFESSPRTVAAERAYYDYSEGSDPDATADQAFKQFETNFPPIRQELVASKFSGWTKHREFLVRYSQMVRARSNLFRHEVLQEVHDATFLKMEEVHRTALLKNLSITKMRIEIGKGAGEFAGWHFGLRFTEDVTEPVITGDNAVALVGFGHSSREEAMKD